MISLLASKSCEKRSKGIEQTWCRASKSARGDGKFAANAATPLQHASAGDSPPTTLLYFSYLLLVGQRWPCVLRRAALDSVSRVKEVLGSIPPATATEIK